MKVYLASDHAGFTAKESLKSFLTNAGHEVEDCGAYSLDESDDYPDLIRPCAEKVASDSGSFGIIFGASGEGEAMVANRVSGIRAAVYYAPANKMQTDASGNERSLLQSARAHNDANILSLGARFLTESQIEEAVTEFLAEPFSGEAHHVRRIGKF